MVPLLRSICFVLFYLFNFARFHSLKTKNNNSNSNYFSDAFLETAHTYILTWPERQKPGQESLKAFKSAFMHCRIATAFPCFPKHQQEQTIPMGEAKFAVSLLFTEGIHAGKSIYDREISATIPD